MLLQRFCNFSIALLLSFCLHSQAHEIHVTSLDDSGVGSLREALLRSTEHNNKIVFDPSLQGTLELQSPLPSITSIMTIAGPTSGKVTIDGRSAYQIFDVNALVSIQNLTLSNGNASLEGGIVTIHNGAILELQNVNIYPSDSIYGAIKVDNNGSLSGGNVEFPSQDRASQSLDISLACGCVAQFTYDEGVEANASIAGCGTVQKYGNGTMALYPSSPVNFVFEINGGTLKFNGTTAGQISIDAGSILKGGNAYSICNMGTFYPSLVAETTATAKIVTDYVQLNSGTLAIAIDAQGNCDSIEAGGNALIYGKLMVTPSQGQYQSGTQYTILTAKGSMSGVFSSVAGLENIPHTIEYDPHAIRIAIQ